eukprot:s2476_g8.t1
MQMQMMQQMQPRLVLRKAVPRQPMMLSYAQAAQPRLGQLHQLPGQLKPGPVGPMPMPVVMPTPMLKHMAKPVAKPMQWVCAAPLQGTANAKVNFLALAVDICLPVEVSLMPGGLGLVALRLEPEMRVAATWRSKQIGLFPQQVPHLNAIQFRLCSIVLFAFFCSLAMQMQMMQPMQPMQPRLVLRQAVLRQPVVVAKPMQWVYAAPMQRTQGPADAKVGLPCQQPHVMSMNVKPPVRKELPLIEPVQGFLVPHLPNQQNIIVVDLRGQDRASGTISGTVPIANTRLIELQVWQTSSGRAARPSSA